jgi:RNA polymerase sigma-70 factor (ECF subfamily)
MGWPGRNPSNGREESLIAGPALSGGPPLGYWRKFPQFVQPFQGLRILYAARAPPPPSDRAPQCMMIDLTEDQASLTPADPSPAPALPPDEEAELVRCAQRDPAAFGVLYEAHYESILNYLYRRTLSITLAEELTSNTFFKALRGLHEFRPRPSIPFRAWLYRIATNEARMYWRGRKAGGQTLPLSNEEDLPRITFVWPEAESPEAVREKQKQYAIVYQALGRLPEPYQSALTLRYFEGLRHEEIAGILGKRPGTIKSLVHRGLAKLTRLITGPNATE